MTIERIDINPGLHIDSGIPVVEITWGDRTAEVSPATARQHGLAMLQAAEAAEADYLLHRILGREAWFHDLLDRMLELRPSIPELPDATAERLDAIHHRASSNGSTHDPERLEDLPPALGASIGLADPNGPDRLTSMLAQAMQAKLDANLHKLHWAHPEVTTDYLLGRLEEEVQELRDTLADYRHPSEVWAEAADVANFAAMLADRTTHTWSDPQ